MATIVAEMIRVCHHGLLVQVLLLVSMNHLMSFYSLVVRQYVDQGFVHYIESVHVCEMNFNRFLPLIISSIAPTTFGISSRWWIITVITCWSPWSTKLDFTT